MTSSYKYNISYELWAAALVSSASIGLTSLVPWVFDIKFTDDNGIDSKDKSRAGNNSKGPQNRRLKLMLSFAVGSILGDIFLHLIPESINCQLIESPTNDDAYKKVGLSIISGVLVFIIVEKLIENWLTEIMADTITVTDSKNGTLGNTLNKLPPSDLIANKAQPVDKIDRFRITDINNNDTICNNNNYHKIFTKDKMNNNSLSYRPNGIVDDKKRITTNRVKITAKQQHTTNNIVGNKIHVIETAGYLNLIANGFDNFTHGLAVGASFLVGFRVGLLTTFVIILHEIPHEICDYAILVKSGFNRWDALKAQSSTAVFGVLGTVTALSVKSVKALSTQTGWILPFSSGGFLYIALVNILPELLDDRTSSRDSFDQIVCILFGISFMAVVAVL